MDNEYQCPSCGEVSTKEELEEDTEAFGVEYICPGCGYCDVDLEDWDVEGEDE